MNYNDNGSAESDASQRLRYGYVRYASGRSPHRFHLNVSDRTAALLWIGFAIIGVGTILGGWLI